MNLTVSVWDNWLVPNANPRPSGGETLSLHSIQFQWSKLRRSVRGGWCFGRKPTPGGRRATGVASAEGWSLRQLWRKPEGGRNYLEICRIVSLHWLLAVQIWRIRQHFWPIQSQDANDLTRDQQMLETPTQSQDCGYLLGSIRPTKLVLAKRSKSTIRYSGYDCFIHSTPRMD